MAIPDKDLRILYQKSGNRCAFESCRELLTAPSAGPEGPAVLGNVAHIVGRSRRGPRGEVELPPEVRDRYAILILMCSRDHKLIDSQPATYPATRLLAMKEAHERWVENSLSAGSPLPLARNYITERLHSNLLHVDKVPRYVYSAPCSIAEIDVAKSANWPSRPLLSPWIVRDGRLYCFQDLGSDNPFSSVADAGGAQRHRLEDWWDSPDQSQWFITMANKALRTFAHSRDLAFDRDHHRFFFPVVELGKERDVPYTSVQGRKSHRSVVYPPKSKKHGTPMSFWIHWAVRLRLIEVNVGEFVLSITPDLRITKDGQAELPSETIGEKVTRRKNRWFNFETLTRVHFWRDYLSDGKPRIVLPFSPQTALVVSTTLMQAQVSWPGIPQEHAMKFSQIEYEDDLFSDLERRLFAEENGPDFEDEDEDRDG